MANPFADEFDIQHSNQIVKEGLLCPICLKDFAVVSRLQEHFDSAHADESRTGAAASSNLGSQIKDLFGKAKKKILKEDGFEVVDNSDVPRQAAMSTEYFTIWRENMEIGQIRNHFEQFKQLRDRRVERYVIETNKLLIRLDKLISDVPMDVEKRKQHEKNVVNWVSDNDVKLCPSCAKSFNITRRRHHCRLCGGIMCHNCSEFLDFDYAKKLISPHNLETNSPTSSNSLAPPALSGSGRRGSTSSLMSIVNPTTGEQHVRVCYDCKVLLDRRNQQIEEQRAKPTMCQYYDRMRSAIEESDKLIPVYLKMCYSFSLGESNYNLADASDLRLKLMKLAEITDVVSRKIAALGTSDYPPPSNGHLQLQAKVRLAATQFLKENMVGLPSLPSQEELEKAQEDRRLEIERKILIEKQLALEEQSQRHQNNLAIPSNHPRFTGQLTRIDSTASSFEVVSPDNGWGPESHNGASKIISTTDDPMLMQMNQVRSYIRRAREDHRYDEVNMLEANLKELEIEYFMQQQQLQELNDDQSSS